MINVVYVDLQVQQGFEKLGELKNGDIVSFYARSEPYIKGYVRDREGIDNRKVDYKLNYPTKIKLLKQ